MKTKTPHSSVLSIMGITISTLLLLSLAGAWITVSTPTGDAVQITNPNQPETSRNLPVRPNIILIRTDDQTLSDFHVQQPNGRLVFQYTNQLLAQQGTTFTQNFTPLSLCCPSRASVLTGQYAHNHNVLDNSAPTGGYFALNHSNTLPIWLQNVGYYTAHLGKYLNEYPGFGIPPGWNEWYTSKDSRYFGYTLNENGTNVNYGFNANEYYTDVIGQKAINFITQHAGGGQPIFLQVDFIAPHGTSPPQLGVGTQPVPAPRHAGIFANYQPTLPAAYNELDVSDKPIDIQNLPLITPAGDQAILTHTRARLETLLAVDEQVRNIMRALQTTGQLDNTYIVFTSDNGYELGEHRIQNGKAQVYEESNLVPLVIRGPGVAAGQTRNEIVANIDLTPTLVEWASAVSGFVQDGHSLTPLLVNQAVNWRQNLLLESFGAHRYTAIRNNNYLYAEHDYDADGIADETELYNFVPDACRATADPYELESQHANPCYSTLIASLHQQLAILKSCTGITCG